MSSFITSNEKGPLAIGFFLAVVVLVGFAIFMMAVDETLISLGGNDTLRAQNRRQKEEIRSLAAHLAELEDTKIRAAKNQETAAKLKKITAENESMTADLESLRAKLASGTEALEAANKEFEDYKNQYREHVRKKAEGEKLEKLVTLGGETYENIIIRKVTPIGIQIRHTDGVKGIPYEDLPNDMQDYYQFDAEQKKQALLKEQIATDIHLAEVASAQSQKKSETAVNEMIESHQNLDRVRQSISLKNTQIAKLQSEITSLQEAISAEEAKKIRRNEVYDRVGGLSRAPVLRIELQKKQDSIATLRNHVQQLQQQLNKAR
jgi:chromosome segregation ATPase